MPKKKNSLTVERVTFTTTTQVRSSLESLVLTGLYGRSVPEAAEAIILEYLRKDIKRSRIELKPLEQIPALPRE